ncbi:hypothetical protein PIB30_059331 [Stylosanthes scabra]|uniref:COBRA-like protein 7 n=1 Tax=Stylosanthes scabra TaxID=79078 RepID=A0ABU6RL19_9FABA|nr:hypothetical protein [Stylosanthes scabra]
MAMALHVNVLFFYIFLIIIAAAPSHSQPQSASSCNGIFLSYTYTGGSRLPPNTSDAANQPYRFTSQLTVLNNGLEDLKSWKVFVGFRHLEWLVSASKAVLADGTELPAAVGNGTVFEGSGVRDLKTAAETAGDLSQMMVTVDMVGTVFGVAPPSVPMPSTIRLSNDGFRCGKPNSQGNNETHTCCTVDPNSKKNTATDEEFPPLQKGDLSIIYDVTKTYDSNYTMTKTTPLAVLTTGN